MAIRSIRTIGDEVLKKECKAVTEVTDHTLELIEDMFDTMYSAGGVGLAAPQVGVLKQIVVIDVTEDGSQPIVLINPQIVKLSGTQTGQEGCLSVPGKAGIVTRANYAKVRVHRLNHFLLLLMLFSNLCPPFFYLCTLGICETITNLPESNGY